MNDCLVSFSSKGRDDYNIKLLTLLDSCIEHWRGDYLIYSPDHNLNEYRGIKINKGLPEPKNTLSLPHSEMPYQFKYALIQQAREMGYERIVWLDTSFTLVKDITPLFKGVTVFDNLGHPLRNYISDQAMTILGVDENELNNINQIWGGAMFFDFTENGTDLIFKRILEHSLNGSFKDGTSERGEFIAHRHDQAVLSVLLHDKSNIHDYGKIKIKQHYTSGEYGNDCYLVYG